MKKQDTMPATALIQPKQFYHSRFGRVEGTIYYNADPDWIEIKLTRPLQGRSGMFEAGEIRRFRRDKLTELKKVKIS